jgi:hypothetical protein
MGTPLVKVELQYLLYSLNAAPVLLIHTIQLARSSAVSYWLKYILVPGSSQSLSIAICQAVGVVSKDLMHSKSASRIGKLLETQDFECIGPYAAVLPLPMHHSEQEEANFSGQLERFSVNKART